MDTTRLTAFAGAAALIIVIPGPSVVFAISRALVVGRRNALASVVGNAVGVLLQVAGLAVGLGELIERSVVAARSWFSRSPRRLAGLGTIGGVAMIGLGAGAPTAQRAT